MDVQLTHGLKAQSLATIVFGGVRLATKSFLDSRKYIVIAIDTTLRSNMMSLSSLFPSAFQVPRPTIGSRLQYMVCYHSYFGAAATLTQVPTYLSGTDPRTNQHLRANTHSALPPRPTALPPAALANPPSHPLLYDRAFGEFDHLKAFSNPFSLGPRSTVLHWTGEWAWMDAGESCSCSQRVLWTWCRDSESSRFGFGLEGNVAASTDSELRMRVCARD